MSMELLERTKTLAHKDKKRNVRASSFNHFTANVQAIQSDQFKLRPVQSSSQRIHKHVTPEWVEERKTRKNPSGPNPVGNHRPPSKQ
ncbi:hypothetical protein L6164_019193 [Bauhinia variegata]|uniref:Uncharacterized protein n=1 Tax=Bauhinia variegata TaxID=167791 RepID=A0ACB9NDJ9_BAUVA|nr:hypothetical protein L6164_019193 [Bauhinia variegata]